MSNAHDQDFNRLKKQMQLQIQKYKEIQLDKEELENKLAEKEADINQWQEKYHQLLQFKYSVQGQQQSLIAQEQQRYEEMEKKNLEEIRKLNFELSQEQQKNQRQANSLDEKDEIIQKFIVKLRDTPGAQNLKEFMEEIEEFKEDRVANVHQLQKQQIQIQELNSKIESLAIQNRVLARMAQVEDDYIIDISEIKKAEDKKAQDYKVQVRYLEQEIEQLEAERQQLRHQLRIATTLFSSNPGERYQGLDKDQLFLLDQYALNLRNGQTQVPLNDRSRELEEENKELRSQLKQLEKMGFRVMNDKQFVGSSQLITTQKQVTTTQLNESKVELMEKQNQDIKNYIKELIETMHGQQQGGQGQFGRQTMPAGGFGQFALPPMAQTGPMGNFDQGYSYRFQTKIPIDLQDYYTENDEFIQGIQAKQEVAFLQLQNLETMKLLELKEAEYEGLLNDSEILKNELKTCLQVQDEMIKRYRTDKQTFNQNITTLKRERDNLADLNEESQRKINAYDQEIQRIESKNENQYEIKLANYAKRIAQLDVNMLRLSRKYDCLSSNERDLRAQYNSIHKEYAEKFGEMKLQLNEAIRYKKKAREQLRIAMQIVHHSFPIDDKKYMESQINDLKFQVVSMKEQNSKLSLKLSQKDSYERLVFEREDQLKEKEEEMLEIELELEIMKDRLLRLDPIYQKYIEVFEKLAHQINSRQLSPLQVFQMIDTNGDGHINKTEFSDAMEQMEIDINKDDADTLFLFLDLDGSNKIEYNEFALKLKRSGVKIKKKEEELIYNIYNVIQQSGYTYRQAFDAFDENKDNRITKKDMKIVFRRLDSSISDADLDYFIKIADNDNDHAINYEEFERLFQQIIPGAQQSQSQSNRELEWHFAVLVTLNEEMHKAGWKLIDLFKDIDIDQNNRIDYPEFEKLFRDMGLPIDQNELKGLFNMIDRDNSTYITYDELQKSIREALREQERVRRQNLLDQRTEQLHKANAERKKDQMFQKELDKQSGISETSRLQMKVKTMEVRQEQQLKWIDTYRKQLDQKDRSLEDYCVRIKELETAEVVNSTNYSELSSSYRELKYRSERGISTIEATHQENVIYKLQLESRDLRSAMDTFKELYETSIHQVQLLKYTLDRQKDETKVNKELMSKLQSESDEKALIGKVMHEMLMVKQAAAETNRKWETQLNELRKCKMQNEKLSNEVVKKEEEAFEVFSMYRKKVLDCQEENESLKKQIIPGVSLSNVNKMNHQLQQVIAMKNELEDINKKLREKNSELEMQVSCIEETKKVLDDIESRLKRSSNSDLQVQMVELGTKIRDLKLQKLQADQKVTLAYEKETYLQRIIKTNQDQIDELQKELADCDIKYQNNQKFWQDQVTKQKKLLYKTDNNNKDANEFNFLTTLNKTHEDTNNKMTTVGREKFMQEITKLLEEIKQLKEDIARMEKEIEQKNRIIEELDMKKMGGGNFNYERMKAQAREEETDKVTEAAAKTISIMQGMIDDKTHQIKKQEEMIGKMRSDFQIQKEADTDQINRLRSELMKQDEKILSLPIHSNNQSHYEQELRGAQKSTNDFLRLEQELEMQKTELESQKGLIKQLEEEKNKWKQRYMEEQNRGGELLTQMESMKSNNEPGYLRHEVATLKKIIKKKDTEIKSFKAALEELKKETFDAMDKANFKNQQINNETKKRQDQDQKLEQYLQTIEKQNNEIEKLKKANLKESQAEKQSQFN